MINFVVLLFLVALIAIPAGAVLAAYREDWLPAYHKLAQALRFDPRHRVITREAPTDRISNRA
jgi:hypothetical protein